MIQQLTVLIFMFVGFLLGYGFCLNEFERNEIKEKLNRLHNELRRDNDGD